MEWEYKVHGHYDGYQPDTREEFLNSMGLKGWELIQVITYEGSETDSFDFYFKRLKGK